MTKQTSIKKKPASRKPSARKPISGVKKRIHERVFESDGTYFLKLVLVFLLATFWLKFEDPVSVAGLMFTAIPVGLFIGLLLVRAFERHQADRKIWYALLIVVTIITHIQPAGFVV